MTIKGYTKQAYPFYYEDFKIIVLLLCGLSAATFLFIILFEPFTVNEAEHKIPSIWIQVVHAILPLPIALAYLFTLKRTVKHIENWTLGKELLHLGILLFLIGIANFLIRDIIYNNPDNWSLRYFWEELRNTFLVGILLLLIVLPLNLERLLQKHRASLKLLPKTSPKVVSQERILIKTPIIDEQFHLNLNAFLFAKADGNYIEVVTENTATIERSIIRMPLKELENQLHAYDNIFKTHRSYIVNLDTITNISGNAQGYLLELKHYNGTIPVSRSKIGAFNRIYSTRSQN